jgi:hypothetical protein
MSDPLLCFMGDLHLSHLIWTDRRLIRGDSFLGFSQVVDRAIEYQVPLVLGGDIFDTVRPDSGLISFFRHEMDRCHRHNIQVFAYQGNHDKAPTPWYCAASEHPIHVGDGKPVEIAGVSVRAFDYAVRDQIEEQMASLVDQPVPQILMLHQAIRQFLRFDGAWNHDADWIPEGIPLTLVGDLHSPLTQRALHGSEVLYSGATHARNWAQIGPKSCVVVRRDLSWFRAPIAARTFTVMTLQPMWVPSDLEARFASLTADLTGLQALPPVLHLRWNHETLDQFALAQKLAIPLTERFGLLVTDDQCGSHAGPATPDDQADSSQVLPSVPDLLGRVIDPDKHPVPYRLALTLLSDPGDAGQLIRDARERFCQLRRTGVAKAP